MARGGVSALARAPPCARAGPVTSSTRLAAMLAFSLFPTDLNLGTPPFVRSSTPETSFTSIAHPCTTFEHLGDVLLAVGVSTHPAVATVSYSHTLNQRDFHCLLNRFPDVCLSL
jgi:hypothetical protein